MSNQIMEINSTGQAEEENPETKVQRTSDPGQSKTLPDLPNDTVIDILSRLPTKSVFSTRCVSKSLLSNTSPPSNFPQLHFSRAHTDLLIHFWDKYEASVKINIIDPEHDMSQGFGQKVKLHTNFIIPKRDIDDDYVLVNSCRGLILLRDYYYYNPCIVANPLTGEYVRVPKFSERKMNLSSRACALGFCKRSNQFKVLRVFETKEDMSETNFPGRVHITVSHTRAEVLTLGTNVWRPVENVLSGSRLLYPIFLNGVIHWLVHDVRWFAEHNPKSKFVVCFDFEREEFREILPPIKIRKSYVDRLGNITIGVLRDYLCLFDLFRKGKFDVWVMKEYGVRESWVKVITVDTNALGLRLKDGLRPIKYLSTGEILMHCAEKHNFVCYDPVKRSARFLEFPFSISFEAIVHTSSFISLKDAIGGDDLEVLKVRVEQSTKRPEDLMLWEYHSASPLQERKLDRDSHRFR